jgi:hypothetical protein
VVLESLAVGLVMLDVGREVATGAELSTMRRELGCRSRT